jgi:hypothetical protein
MRDGFYCICFEPRREFRPFCWMLPANFWPITIGVGQLLFQGKGNCMHIETLEDRRLLSASPVLAHDSKPSALSLKVDQALIANPLASAIFSEKFAHNVKTSLSAFLEFEPAGSPTTAPFPFTVTLISGIGAVNTFVTSSISPFPTTYNLKVNSANSLNLFNVKQTIGGKHLKFTGVLKKNLTTLSGVLQINGGGVKYNLTYVATLGAHFA